MRYRFLFSVLCLAIALPFGVQAKTSGDALTHAAQKHYSLLASETRWLNSKRPLKADDLRGRVILLDFWAYCCINCIHTLPKIAALEERFGDTLTVIGVHSAKFTNEAQSRNIRDAILRYGITHPVVNDADFRVWKGFDVHAWPTLVLLDPNGNEAARYAGEPDIAKMTRDITGVIDAFKGSLRVDALPIALESKKEPPHELNFPSKLTSGVLADGTKALFIADTGNHRIVVTDLLGQILHVVGAGESGYSDGPFDLVRFDGPQGVLYDAPYLFVADTGNHALRVIDFDKQQVRSLAGTQKQARVSPRGNIRANMAALSSPWDLAFYPDREHIVIAMTGWHQLWQYDRKTQRISVLAGNAKENIIDGKARRAALAQPSGLAVLGSALYFVDAETSSLRVLENGVVRSLIGTGLFDFGFADGLRKTALMQHPLGLTTDGTRLYIADSYNHALRSYVPRTRRLETVSLDSGKASPLLEPAGVHYDNGTVYIADTNHHAIRTYDPRTQQLGMLAITPKDTLDDIALSDSLPNLLTVAPMTFHTGQEAHVTFEFAKGWHVNADAPSYVAFFDKGSAHRAIAQYDAADIAKGALKIPAGGGSGYRLQGTVYYCQDGENSSQCLIKSIDVPVSYHPTGALKTRILIQ